MEFAQAAAMANMADRDLALAVGMPHMSNPIEIPPPPIPPIHYNNHSVTVSGGAVGAINFGNVSEIQVNLQALTQNGEFGVADAMANLTSQILNSNEIAESAKNDLLEQVAFLAKQSSVPTAERKPGMIKAAVAAVKEGASTISSLASTWSTVEPLLRTHLGT